MDGAEQSESPHKRVTSHDQSPQAAGPNQSESPHKRVTSHDQSPQAAGPSQSESPHKRVTSHDQSPQAAGPSQSEPPQAAGPSQSESLYARATRLGPGLPGALAQVAAFLARHPDRVAGGSALDIAAAVGTSDASVIRTVRALGYSGMKQARRAALDLVARRADPSEVLQRRMQSTADGSHLRKVVDDTAQAIDEFRDALADIDWDAVVDDLADAERVFCFGLKPVGSIADYLAFMLTRVGADARSSSTTGVLLADELLQLRAGDAVVLFAPIRQFDEVTAIARTARAAGAPVVLITEAIGMPIRTEVDHVITTAATSLTAASDSSIPLMIAQAIVHAVAARHHDRTLDALERLNALRPDVSHQSQPLTPDRLGILPDEASR